ncbi:MAG: hypothetical protein JST93_20740 [Acidobacteria bacterium]|nr:hypothetical protein [Acidobacteriota bacterium]
MAFLDLVREKQKSEPALPAASKLLGGQALIESQQTTIDCEGNLISVVMTREPWSTHKLVTHTEEARRYDGVLYYRDDDWVIILENKPREIVFSSELRAILEKEMCPNLPAGSQMTINPHAVNVVWRDILLRLDALGQSGMIHGPEKTLLEDFRSYVHRHFPILNPYSSLAACDRSAEAVRQRCGEILDLIAPGHMRREGLQEYMIEFTHGYAGRIYLQPEPVDPTRVQPVTQIRLLLYPALKTVQAQKFYSDKRIDQRRFLGLSSQWNLQPELAFRVRGTRPNFTATVAADGEKYFVYWRSHHEDMKGNRERDLVAGQLWDRWVASGLVLEAEREAFRAAFTAKQQVNVCPGWRLSHTWNIATAEGLDSKRRPQDESTDFVEAVRGKLAEAYRAMGAEFGDFIDATTSETNECKQPSITA